MKKLISILLLFLVSVGLIADSATLAWDRAASHTNLSAFILKYGESSGNWTNQISVATNNTQVTVNSLAKGHRYYFIVTAKNVAGLESDPSNQIFYDVPGDVTPPDTNAPAPPTEFRGIP